MQLLAKINVCSYTVAFYKYVVSNVYIQFYKLNLPISNGMKQVDIFSYLNTRHCKYIQVYMLIHWCKDTVLNSTQHKHTLTKQSHNFAGSNNNPMMLLRTTQEHKQNYFKLIIITLVHHSGITVNSPKPLSVAKANSSLKHYDQYMCAHAHHTYFYN